MPVPSTREPIAPERTLLRHVAHDKIRAAILDGTLQPGDLLREAELTEWLGVSRMPIREALSELVHQGLVEMEPNRFTRVTIPDPARALEYIQALGVLHSGAVRFGLPLLPDDAVHQVRDSCGDLLRATEVRDVPRIRAIVFSLFTIFIEYCGNTLYRERVVGSIDGFAFFTPVDAIDRLLDEDALNELQIATHDLSRAVLERDVDAAREATRRMHFGWGSSVPPPPRV